MANAFDISQKIYNLPAFCLAAGKNFYYGQKLLLSEIGYLTVKSIRLLEIKQLQRMLQKELALAGKLTHEKSERDPDLQAKERKLSQDQIDFLEREIEFLKNELQNYRDKLIKKRVEKWNFADK